MKSFKTFLIEEESKKKWFEKKPDLRKRSAAQLGRDLFATGVVMSGIAQVGTDVMGFLDKALTPPEVIAYKEYTKLLHPHIQTDEEGKKIVDLNTMHPFDRQRLKKLEDIIYNRTKKNNE